VACAIFSGEAFFGILFLMFSIYYFQFHLNALFHLCYLYHLYHWVDIFLYHKEGVIFRYHFSRVLLLILSIPLLPV